MSGHDGTSPRFTVIVPPATPSERSACAAVPRATTTAPPAGIATAPPSVLASTTGATRSTSGVAAGKGNRITAALPGSAGVLAPYASVYSAAPLAAGSRVERTERTRPYRGAPRALEAHPPNVEHPVAPYPGARPPRVRRRDELRVPHQDTRRLARREREVVAVDAGRRGCPPQPHFHCRQLLATDDRVVREHGLESRQAAGPWPAQHVDRHRPVRRELDARLVRDTRPELTRRGDGCRHQERGGERRDGGE